ncbi:MAG: T9SS type A sorting domain-containing protein [Cytophagales bacterium]|nr:T9SS type A sorting domain-containing protein [Cytophagales bacterium]MDW8385297.1 T9SS type A sorting domain-containing protein [Flammeovirgaceae bacterium]
MIINLKVFLICYGGLSLGVIAQPYLTPLGGRTFSLALSKVSSDSLNQQMDSIARAQDSLIKVVEPPFFDDFTHGSFLKPFQYWAQDGGLMIPDTNLWLRNSGVYLNNHLGFDAPSIFVASFDGTDLFGRPYQFSSASSKGKADSLVSVKINLSRIDKDTGAALVFWFQPQGYAHDAPDAGTATESGDSLSLYVRTTRGWQLLWQANGSNLQPFTKVYILLKDTVFFHTNFQIKFQNKARLSGIYDFWHIDRVMLYDRRDSLRSPVQFFQNTLDLSFSKRMSPALRTFRAVPMEHFKHLARFQTNGTLDSHPWLTDSVSAFLNNNSDKNYAVSVGQAFSAITLRALHHQKIELIDFQTKQILKMQGVRTISNNGIISLENQPFTVSPFDTIRLVASNKDLWKGIFLTDSMILELRMSFDFDESATLFRRDSVSAFRVNDTLKQFLSLTDYYAYDDGTAEYGFGINAPAGKLAYQFVIPKADTLTAIDVYFPQMEFDLESARKSFFVCVWKNINFQDARLDSRIVRRPFTAVNYSKHLNEFVRIPLRDTIVLADTFYIGFEEPSFGNYNQLLIGYDIHTNVGNRAFYNVTGKWLPVTFPGSLMLRPVFGRTTLRVHTGVENNRESITVYPNPAYRVLYVESFEKILRVEVLNSLGEKLSEYKEEGISQINLDAFSSGLYIIKLYTATQIVVKKVYKIE